MEFTMNEKLIKLFYVNILANISGNQSEKKMMPWLLQKMNTNSQYEWYW